uniref:Transmembrane protein n=1 Tax=Pithovirus LCPAC404 TaxID=2506597 RepID=A0A481ZCY0_9VIRU|nr:MAG: uncharacterized protein LCPAC404_03310 [Pithovirus LCPAC404]
MNSDFTYSYALYFIAGISALVGIILAIWFWCLTDRQKLKDEDIHTKDSAMLWFFIAISLALLAIFAGAKTGGMYAYKHHLFGLK